MVPVPAPAAIVAPTALDNLTKNVSSGSTDASFLTATFTSFEVSPGLNVSVPLVAV